MLLMTRGLNVSEDVPDCVVEYVLGDSRPKYLINSNHSVVFIHDSSGFVYSDIPNQSPPKCLPLLYSGSVMPLNARIMTFEYQSDLNSSKYVSQAARCMCLDLHEARKNVQ